MHISFSLICKTLRVIVTLFVSNFFLSSRFHGYFVPFQLYLFIIGLIFDILYGFLLIYSYLLQQSPLTENIYQNLSCGIYNTTVDLIQKNKIIPSH